MGQAEILKLLEENMIKTMEEIKKIDKTLDYNDELFKKALGKHEIIEVLGISLQSVTNSLNKLVKKEHVKIVKSEIDKRYNGYILNEEKK